MGRLNKAAMDNVVYRADRLLPRLPGLAEERHRRRRAARCPFFWGVYKA